MTAAADSIEGRPPAARRLQVDLLFLDLTACTRCRGADRNLEAALEAAREVLAAAGTEPEVNRIHVTSAEQARQLRLVSSPTIRVNGRDIALELRESTCGSGACTAGCGDSIACRVWVHEGREYTEPPVAMIIDGILREAYTGAAGKPRPGGEGYELPKNLERFFASRAAASTVVAPEQADAPATGAACCSVAEQRACCEPGEKAKCCGAASGTGCGCR